MTDDAESQSVPSVNDTGGGAMAHRFFGGHLDEVLIAACEGRLTGIRWFRTDWQRGGALTGYGRYYENGRVDDVIIKLPVPPQERRWLMQLQDDGPYENVVPHLYAEGIELGGYDFAWLIMERLSHGPLDPSRPEHKPFERITDAIGRFYAASARYPVNRAQPKQEDWQKVIQLARDNIRKKNPSNGQVWNTALKEVKKRFKKYLPVWEARETTHWIHGDLHCGNAMTRSEEDAEPAILFDLAEIRPGHWIEDAINFERIYWVCPQYLDGVRIDKAIADQRRAHDLHVSSDWSELANIRRLMLAAAAPAFPAHDRDPVYLHACLNKVHQLLDVLH